MIKVQTSSLVFVAMVVAILFLMIGCKADNSRTSAPPPVGKQSASAQDEHPLAHKPLKLISPEKSRALLLQENIEEAEQRSLSYKHRLNVGAHMPEPKLPPLTNIKPVSLEEAISGIKGGGPLRISINTTAGRILCTVDTNDATRREGVTHFVALARGLKPWWNRRVTTWSNEPFFTSTVVYKIFPRKGFYAGFPPEAGDSRLAYPAVVTSRKDTEIPAYTLSVLYAKGTKMLDTNFAITAVKTTFLDKGFFPVADCAESKTLIDEIAGSQATGEGIPLKEIRLEDIEFSRP